MSTVHEKMTEIADCIRSHTGGTEKLSLDEMAQGVDQVFDAGSEKAKQTFWDEYQRKGLRTNYLAGFGGYGWHSNTFWPRYDIKPKGSASCLFYYFGQQKGTNGYIDLVARLKECGVILDFAQCTSFNNAFAYAFFTRVGVIDTTGATDLARIFANAFITSVGELRLKPEGGQTFSQAFFRDSNKNMNIVDIKVTGKITNSIDLHQCRNLSAESIKSFLDALSTTIKGKSITVSKDAVNKAFANRVYDEYGNLQSQTGSETDEWKALVARKPNWTVYLA